jgi:hypothetical protein
MNGVTSLVDCSDLLRWQWVQAVSALDKFLHDVVRIGMIEIFNGERNPTAKYKNFMIGLETLNQILTSTNLIERSRIIEQQILHQNSYKSFQTPNNIGDALAYVWDESYKWKMISRGMPETPEENDVKTQLNNIILRRNQIVHEGDCQSDTLPLERQTIDLDDVNETIAFLKNVAQSIYDCIAIQ